MITINGCDAKKNGFRSGIRFFLPQIVCMELQMFFYKGSNRKVTMIVTIQFFVAHFFTFSGFQEGFLIELDIIKIVSSAL